VAILTLYGELAPWFHLLTPPEEYADDAAFILGLLREHVDGPLETLLELGSGGGNTASHLRLDLRVTLTDLSPQMLELSLTLNPEAEHQVGDMRTLRLGRTFDSVLIHDAICYMNTESDLRAALATAFEHLRPGGAAIFEPDHIRETFQAGTDHGGEDAPSRPAVDPAAAFAISSGPLTPILPTTPTRWTTRSCSVTRLVKSMCATIGMSRASSHERSDRTRHLRRTATRAAGVPSVSLARGARTTCSARLAVGRGTASSVGRPLLRHPRGQYNDLFHRHADLHRVQLWMAQVGHSQLVDFAAVSTWPV